MPQKFPFKKGWNQLPQIKVADCQNDIMEALDIKAKSTFYARLNGDVEPKISEANIIESIFKLYGITDIWGE